MPRISHRWWAAAVVSNTLVAAGWIWLAVDQDTPYVLFLSALWASIAILNGFAYSSAKRLENFHAAIENTPEGTTRG